MRSYSDAVDARTSSSAIWISCLTRAEIAAIVVAMPQKGREGVVTALNAFAQAAGEAAPPADTATGLGW